MGGSKLWDEKLIAARRRRFLATFTLLLMAGGTAAQAQPLTCAAFQDRLAAAIRAAGDKVATPRWETPHVMPYLPGKWSDFDGVVGLSGNVECGDDGRLVRVEIETQVDSDDLVENGRRIARAQDLAAASICAVEPLGAAKCRAIAKDTLLERAFRSFVAAKRRGEEIPDSLQEIELKKSNASADVTIAEGSVRFSVGNASEPVNDTQR
jgi:hypothetical protein